jgi:hypothetical protein
MKRTSLAAACNGYVRSVIRAWALGPAVLTALSCAAPPEGPSPPPPPPPPPFGVSEPPLRPGCNPLGGGEREDCFTPFPSSFYTRPDPQNPGRVLLALPAEALPVSNKGIALDPKPLVRRDGFSPATPLIAYFPTPLDEKGLPGPHNQEDSLKPRSPVQLFRFDTGERVPLMAELDRNAGDGERQGLIIYPALRLQPKTRYVVALSGLYGRDGQLVPALQGFAALRDDKLAAGSVRAGLKPRYAEIFALLEQKGLVRKDLQLAWDFTTASDEPLTGRLVRMRDAAWSYAPPGAPPPPPPVTIQMVNDRPTEPLLRQIIGTFTVPSFLEDDSAASDGTLKLDADGEPVIRGYGQFPLVIHIPKCAATAMGPLPVMIFGHGMFGGALDEMDSGYEREITNRLCMVQIGSDWLGVAEADRDYVATKVLADWNHVSHVTERLQQAHVIFATLARLIKQGGLDKLAELQLGGRLILDSQHVFYYGISNGGIQGLTALALSPDLGRGCLNVGGGFWSRMLWRSTDFHDLATVLGFSYPDPLDRQVLVALSQPLWDYVDPATYAPHVLQDVLPGVPGPKRVLYQMGLGDAQVPNLMTYSIIRTLGLGMLSPPVEAVFGIGQVPAPAPSAFVQFDIGQMPRPGDTNVPPEKDNRVHEAIRRLEAAKAQLQAFLKEDGKDGGQVLDTCGGKPCVFTGP